MLVALATLGVLLITGSGWPPAALLLDALVLALIMCAALTTAGRRLWRRMRRR